MSGSSVKRVVITGGPGSGKTTLIKQLEVNGFKVYHEVSRDIIKKARQRGIDQLFLEDPLSFSLTLLNKRTEQFRDSAGWQNEAVFFDRGLPDVPSYLDFIGITYPNTFGKVCELYRYDQVFILPPWKEIYHQDSERYESYSTAHSIYEYLQSGYRKFGYEVNQLPPGGIQERLDYLLLSLKP